MLLLVGLAVAAGFVGAGLAGITVTVFLHRGLTHGAIEMGRPLYELGRWMTWLTTFMRHWEWRRVHRKHHIYTDVWIDEIRHDPHSPVVISTRDHIDGFRRVAWHMASIFHVEAQCPDIRDATYDTDADRPLDGLDRRVFDRPVVGAVVTGALYVAAFALLGPVVIDSRRAVGFEALCALAGVLALATHIGLLLRFGGAINSDCHRGTTLHPGAGYAMNVGLLSVLIFGEGEHLTHHLYPQLARISRRFDLGWRVIHALTLAGLARVVVDRDTILPR